MRRITAVEEPCGIYIIEAPDGRAYVGSSVAIRSRWRQHQRLLRAGRHHSYKLQMAWDKFGEEGFSFRILKCLDDPAHLIPYEQYYLDTLNPALNIKAIASEAVRGADRVERQSRGRTRRAVEAAGVQWGAYPDGRTARQRLDRLGSALDLAESLGCLRPVVSSTLPATFRKLYERALKNKSTYRGDRVVQLAGDHELALRELAARPFIVPLTTLVEALIDDARALESLSTASCGDWMRDLARLAHKDLKEKPFPCLHCGQRFATWQRVRDHEHAIAAA